MSIIERLARGCSSAWANDLNVNLNSYCRLYTQDRRYVRIYVENAENMCL